MVSGKIRVSVLDARSLKDSRLFGKMKPYAVLFVGAQIHRTQKSSGKQPVWNGTFDFDVLDSTPPQLDIKVLDDGDLLGALEVNFGEMAAQHRKVDAWYQLSRNGKASGEVHLALQFSDWRLPGPSSAGPSLPPAPQFSAPQYPSPSPHASGIYGLPPPPTVPSRPPTPPPKPTYAPEPSSPTFLYVPTPTPPPLCVPPPPPPRPIVAPPVYYPPPQPAVVMRPPTPPRKKGISPVGAAVAGVALGAVVGTVLGANRHHHHHHHRPPFHPHPHHHHHHGYC